MGHNKYGFVWQWLTTCYDRVQYTFLIYKFEEIVEQHFSLKSFNLYTIYKQKQQQIHTLVN